MHPLDWEENAIQAMRDEIASLLAGALRVADETSAETSRVQHVHDDEVAVSQKVHNDQTAMAQETHDHDMEAVQHLHDGEMHNMDLALASRDIIGQAKGIIMATMHCTAEEAFRLLINQSQAENRKLVEIATEITARASRRAAG